MTNSRQTLDRPCWALNRLILTFAISYSSCGRITAEPLALSNRDLLSFVNTYCLKCHDQGSPEGGLSLDTLLDDPVEANAQLWELVIRKLASRQMPPVGEERPDEETYDKVAGLLADKLDEHAKTHVNPGRTESFRRLTRYEYQNAIRDLLSLDIDAADLLPNDEASHGFDNITVSNLSPLLLDRYLSAAQSISRLAIGARANDAAETIYRIAPDVTQDAHLPGTPLGTRGGKVLQHYFPRDGEYVLHIRLMRDRNEELEGRPGTYELDLLVDRNRIALLPFERPRGADDGAVDKSLTARFTVNAGPHEVGAVFLKKASSLQESVRQPLNVHYNFYRHPRIEPAVYQISILGPLEGGKTKDSPSRRRVFTAIPKSKAEESTCARTIIESLVRRAYRKQPDPADLESPLRQYAEGHAEGGFDVGIERALATVLVNPQFLFRIERTPESIPAGAVYTIPSVELASRLSFFLWSSIPDDELLSLGISGELQQPEVLESQVRRMLADDRANALVHNFAAQWLQLRNLDSFIPDMRLYPDFDENLRQAMRMETELFFQNIVREDLRATNLIDSPYTFLNERLARHYGISHVSGSRFRKVVLDESSHRGGLLRQASILCVTSYANRTSPVLRGKWVLENMLGSPPPPPPPNVPSLDDAKIVSATLSVRDRLKLHRENPSCAACHATMDPVGFTLESFDATGAWRDIESDRPVDCSAVLPDGGTLSGVADLEARLLERPELFVQTLTEKLLTYAIGRGLDYRDAPAVRQIVRESRSGQYKFSDIVLGIVRSAPFRMRNSE